MDHTQAAGPLACQLLPATGSASFRALLEKSKKERKKKEKEKEKEKYY